MTSSGSPQPRATATDATARRVTNLLEGEFTGAPVPATYYPLVAGNRWHYRSRNTVSVENDREVTESVESEHVLDVRPNDLGGVSATVCHRLRVDGDEDTFNTRLRQNDRETADLDARTVYLQGPIQVGRQWSWIDDNDNLHLCEIAGPEPIDVPAGSFPGCIRVRESFLNRQGNAVGSRTDWFAPEVGRVRSLFQHDSVGHGSFEEVRELLHYEVRYKQPKGRSGKRR